MTSFYDEIEIEDMDYDEIEETYYFPCPCGDKFQITLQDLQNGEEIGTCPSCSLIIRLFYLIRIIYDPEDFMQEEDIIDFDEAGELVEA